MHGGKITVLLVDDHAVVREGYRRLLERRGDIVVIGEAANAAEAHELFCSLAPQVVVMDIALPGVSGIEAMRRMLAREPGTRVLIFSMYEDAIFANRALQAGASGYVTKASAPNVLVEAVHVIARGKRYISADIAQELALRNVVASTSATDGLSAREFEVLRLLVQGRSVREIAQTLGLTPKTVANHQSAIKQKLGADTAVQLVRIASRLGLDQEKPLSPPEA
ncbi:MAG: response regulator transcription factor [Steroidobacteraceae bacterium]|nr:response regulator transcription factor [Steroidobacteraceae bacterium]